MTEPMSDDRLSYFRKYGFPRSGWLFNPADVAELLAEVTRLRAALTARDADLFAEYEKDAKLVGADGLGPFDGNALKAWHGLFVWMQERLAARDEAIRVAEEALKPFAGTACLFPNEPPMLVDICTNVRALQRVDSALSALAAAKETNG